jgi:hypothetical protein
MYSLNVGNAARDKPQVLTPVTVSRVGRKYFSTKKDPNLPFEVKYRLEDWREENGGYAADSKIYRSELEYQDELAAGSICQELGEIFRYGGNAKKVSLNNLRLIKRIYDSSNPEMKMLDETGPEVLAYLNSLKVGDEVIETTRSAMHLKKGVVYMSEPDNDTCVRWDLGNGKWMGTTVTWGTRKLTDAK